MCAYFFNGGGWNENAHLALTRALLEERRLEIDTYAYTTGDVFCAEGHVYTNKPPGLSLLALPAYAVSRTILDRSRFGSNRFVRETLSAYVATISTSGISAAIIAMILFSAARDVYRTDHQSAVLIAVTGSLATPILPYSTVLFLHVTSAALVLGAFVAARRRTLTGAIVSGVLSGWSALVNYLCLPVVVLNALFLVSAAKHRFRRFVAFFFASLTGLIPLFGYQKYALGEFFGNPVAQNETFASEGAAFGVLDAVRIEVLWEITFGGYRGLLFMSPVMLLAIVGIGLLFRRTGHRLDALYIAVTAGVFVVFYLTFNAWHGGDGVGPRYLVPAVPLLTLGLGAFAPATLRYLVAPAAVVSFASALLATAVDPHAPVGIRNPYAEYYLPAVVGTAFGGARISEHQVSLNPNSTDGVHSPWSSFNVGEVIFGAGDLRSVIPIVVFLAVALPLLFRLAIWLDTEYLGSAADRT